MWGWQMRVTPFPHQRLTSTLTRFRSHSAPPPLLSRSHSRPGVATTTCGRPHSSRACCIMSIPPTTVEIVSPSGLPSTRNCSASWKASSLERGSDGECATCRQTASPSTSSASKRRRRCQMGPGVSVAGSGAQTPSSCRYPSWPRRCSRGLPCAASAGSDRCLAGFDSPCRIGPMHAL